MERIRIAAMGDSITKGVVLTGDGNYSVLDNNFVDLLRKHNNIDIDNLGKFGCTISFAHHITDHYPEKIASSDYTILEYGGNDCDFYWKRIALDPTGEHQPKTKLEEFRREFVKLIEKVRALGSRPIILSLPPIESKEYFDFFSRKMNDEQRDNILGWMGGEVEAISRWHDSYNQVLFGVASETSTPILDITQPFSNYSDGWRSLLCQDGIHPNSEGHRLIASSIMAATSFGAAV